MKILALTFTLAVLCLLSGCAFTVDTPYGSASSDGKTAKVVTQYGSGSVALPKTGGLAK